MKTKLKLFIQKHFKPKSECEHGFEMLDVVNLDIDPKCFWCDKKLSELTNGKTL